MTLPNFLLIGAAKSGTVSLYHYLGQHPDIFMCPVNECNFFALENLDPDGIFQGPVDRKTAVSHCIWERASYEALFTAARPHQTLGESSPLYLYSPLAPANIQRHTPQARLIAILRQPADRAYANYRHYRRAGIEPLADFGQALAAEAERIANGWGPWPFWQYRQLGFYAAQLQRYYTHFDREQIMVCLYDDLQADPVKLLQKMFAFIGVDERFVPNTAVRHNIGGQPRNRFLYQLMTRANPLKAIIKAILSEKKRKQVRDTIHDWNVVKPPFDPVLRQQLNAAYREDMLRLQALIGRDLSHWLA
jgi:hypothetical protein